MNICFFSDVHVSMLRGGVEKITFLLSDALCRKGHNVVLLSIARPIGDDALLKNQYVLPDDLLVSQNNINYIKKLVKEKKIDIIVNQSETLSTYQLLKESRGKSILITCIHNDPATLIKDVNDKWDFWKIKHGAYKYALLYPYILIRKKIQIFFRLQHLKEKYKKHYDGSDSVVLLSKNYISIFKRIAQIDNTAKIRIIQNPVSLNLNSDANYRKDNVIIFVGRLVFQKRIDRLLRIWNKIKNKEGWKFLIIGDGPDKAFFQEINHRLNNENVEFLGLQNPVKFYKQAKILCLGSSYEGSPCVIQEALYHGVIPLTFNSYEAANDYIDNTKTGYLITPFDINKYVKVLSSLINDDNLITKIQNNIKEQNICYKHHNETIIGLWEDLFRELLRKNNI